MTLTVYHLDEEGQHAAGTVTLRGGEVTPDPDVPQLRQLADAIAAHDHPAAVMRELSQRTGTYTQYVLTDGVTLREDEKL